MKATLGEIAALVQGTVDQQNAQLPITGLASIAEAGEGDLTFFGNPKYLGALKSSKASAALVPVDFSEQIAAIPVRVENPSLAFATVLGRFRPPSVTYPPGIHPSAVVAPDAQIGVGACIQACAVIESGVKVGPGSIIGAHVYLGQNAVVGADCHIYPNVTIRENSLLGDRVIIHSGTVIGSDGFGYETQSGKHVKIPQIGIVQIDNDVEIGANTTIDRARFGRTWIQEGTKIDNLVQIAHNVVVGKHSILVSQVGISGSTRLGSYVTLAGQVGVVGHIEIGDQVIVGAKSGVSKSIPKGQRWYGIPAGPADEYKVRLGYVGRLKRLYERVKQLELLVSPKNPAQ